MSFLAYNVAEIGEFLDVVASSFGPNLTEDGIMYLHAGSPI